MTRADVSIPEAPTTTAAVFQMITGHYLSTAIHTAAGLRLADAMEEPVVSHTVLAERTGTHPESLLRLLSLLATAGLVTDEGDGCFSLTEAGRLLREDGEDSLHAVALMHAGPGHVQRLFELGERLKSAPKTRGAEEGANPFAQMPPHIAAIFNRAMTFFSRHTAQAVIDAYDFGGFRSLVDVGGGEGSLLAAILRATPALRGVLFDLPSVVAAGERTLADAGLAERGEVLGGDFFSAVPAGHDAYLLKNVVHDWDDERSLTLLRNIRDAMKPESRLLLVESVRPARFDTGVASTLTAYSHLGMLLGGGAERSEREYAELLADAGLGLTRVVPARPAWTGEATVSVIEATRN
ncbi:methyltransferase [Streptomyces sp. NPDC096153]|uniref:methyltransferase n=1 Tax=Streptomyces sp. NPDC096153 TaxID=3155548 RepID=UPI00332B1C9C